MFDVSTVLEEIKASPYEEISIKSPHTGVVAFSPDISVGGCVMGPSGTFKEKKGALLATVCRERNTQPIYCPERGEIVEIHRQYNDGFVEAGTELLKIRHFLSKDEVLQLILKKALYLFLAPERAKYYFIPAVDMKIKVSGPQSVYVREGDDLLIMSRMKREAPLRYSGPDGVIYAIYFNHTQNVDLGQPLIGICPPDQVKQIEEVVVRVQTEWKERE